jgi:uncharacterized protein YndB with AHSA1/START domain
VAKKALIIAALFLVVFAVAVAMQPDTYSVKRSATMSAPPAAVFALVNDLAAWDRWSPWKEMDPKAAIVLSDPAAGKGAFFTWSGNDEVGEGRVTILESNPPHLILTEQAFIRPMTGSARSEFSLSPAGDGTLVTWKMTGDNDFLGKAMCLFVDMDAMIGKDFERGLANMKAVAERAAAP